jgi:hypothetical protein
MEEGKREGGRGGAEVDNRMEGRERWKKGRSRGVRERRMILNDIMRHVITYIHCFVFLCAVVAGGAGGGEVSGLH